MVFLRYALVGCCVTFQPWSAAAQSTPSETLLTAILERETLLLSYGNSHPKVLECRRQIEELRTSGARIDVGSAERALARATRRRTQLRNDFGTWHPEVLVQTRQIAFLANLLNGHDAVLKK